MEPIKSEKRSTPYAYQKYIDEQKHLDTDELRHTMKPIIHVVVQDLKGEEHKYCDKEQLCPLGKFRRPKKMMEAESKGFASVAEMVEADKKAEEDAKQKKVEQQQKEIDDLKEMVKALMAKIK
jgi:2-methylcitrate dehydratase PrpD